jgi:ferredoxin
MHDSPPLIPPDKTWSHSPSPARDESKSYRLPKNEVLGWLMHQTSFLAASSTPANDEYRGVIYGQQYPRLGDDPRPRAPRPRWDADEAAARIDDFVRRFAASRLDNRLVKIGCTPVLREHVYSNAAVTGPHAIVLGLPMRFDETNAAPEPRAGEEVTRNYMELGALTLALAEFLRDSGYLAQVHHPRGDEAGQCEMMFIPHALAAGLGELGRHGSMISRDFGPRVRLSMITTDAPIQMPEPRETGVLEFCSWCTKCLAACPVDAIEHDRRWLRGSYRFVVNTTRCLPYFAQTDGCGICIAVCPYNKPDELQTRAFHDSVLDIDWVKEAIAIRRRDGMAAMESFVHNRKSGQRH